MYVLMLILQLVGSAWGDSHSTGKRAAAGSRLRGGWSRFWVELFGALGWIPLRPVPAMSWAVPDPSREDALSTPWSGRRGAPPGTWRADR